MFVTGLQALACLCRETTPPDEHGYAICVRCGRTLVVRLTRYTFDRLLKAQLRR